MRYLYVLLLLTGNLHAQTAPPSVPKFSASSAGDQPLQLYPIPRGYVRPGEALKLERGENNTFRIGPALGRADDQPGVTHVLIPAAAADALISSQTKLITELMNKINNLESRVQKLEGRGVTQ